jgi:hypothetical protein
MLALLVLAFVVSDFTRAREITGPEFEQNVLKRHAAERLYVVNNSPRSDAPTARRTTMTLFKG